ATPHAVHHAVHERALAEDRVLRVVEREERDPSEHADPDHDEQLDLLEEVAVLAREHERVAADEVAVREDLPVRDVGARAALVQDGGAVDVDHAKARLARAIAPVDVLVALPERLVEEADLLECGAAHHARIADHPVDVAGWLAAPFVTREAA